MREIILSEFEKTRDSWGNAMPFAIAFVYPKNGDPVVVKGMLLQVEKYVEKTFPVSFYNISMWKNGRTRGSWQFTNDRGYVFRRKNKWEIVLRNKDSKEYKEMYLKRMPHRWIPEFDF